MGGKGPGGSVSSTTTFNELPNTNYSVGYDTYNPYKWYANNSATYTNLGAINNNPYTYYDNQGNRSFNAPSGGKGNIPTVSQPVTTYYDKDGRQVAQMPGNSTFSNSGKGSLFGGTGSTQQSVDQNTNYGSYLNN